MEINEILDTNRSFYAILYGSEYYLKYNGLVKAYDIYNSRNTKQYGNRITAWGITNFRACYKNKKFKFIRFDKRSNMNGW